MGTESSTVPTTTINVDAENSTNPDLTTIDSENSTTMYVSTTSENDYSTVTTEMPITSTVTIETSSTTTTTIIRTTTTDKDIDKNVFVIVLAVGSSVLAIIMLLAICGICVMKRRINNIYRSDGDYSKRKNSYLMDTFSKQLSESSVDSPSIRKKPIVSSQQQRRVQARSEEDSSSLSSSDSSSS